MTPKQLLKWRGERTQTEAATALGVKLRAYQYWESGEPIPRTVLLLIKALEATSCP